MGNMLNARARISETKVIELLAHGASPPEVLNHLCSLVDAQVGAISSVLLLEDDGTRLRWVAGPSLPKKFFTSTHEFDFRSWITSSAAAAYRKTPASTLAIGSDSLFKASQDLVLSEGVRTTWSTPLYSSSQTPLGLLSTFYSEQRILTSEHTELLRRVAYLASIAIGRTRSEKDLRDALERLSHSQDEERRRIARELHDCSGQNLAALTLTLELMARESEQLPASVNELRRQCSELTKTISDEIRTLSYLLHPPLLDECGLAFATEWFVSGVNQRNGLHVDVQISKGFERLPQEVEIALFRVIQASLTNVHLHSGSTGARVEMRQSPEAVTVTIQDAGHGIPAEVLNNTSRTQGLGVGIEGMRARIEHLGGRLVIESSSSGTLIKATVPKRSESRDL